MVEAYEANLETAFAERLLLAVDEGLAAGGETKPIMSSALLIADRNTWPLVDLRIDWKENPLTELRELWDFFKPHQERFVKQVLTPAALTLLSDSPMNV
jgi:uncharacterized Ntn-hydrolase superfamily protein